MGIPISNNDYNTAVGNGALSVLTIGSYNVVVGVIADTSSGFSTGSYNVHIGGTAGANNVDYKYNVVISGDASNISPDSGETSVIGNVVVGASNEFGGIISPVTVVGYNNTNNYGGVITYQNISCFGSNNIADGNSNIIFGNNNNIAFDNNIAIGYGITPIADNTITIGDSTHTSIEIGGIDFSGGPGGGSVEGVDAFKITAISTTSTFSFYGAGVTTVGTLASLTLSNTNVFRKVPMVSAASAAGAGSGCGIYSTQPTNMFPSAASLSGGFRFNCIVSIDDASGAIGDAGRTFFGLSENVGALPNSNPSSGFGGSNTLGIGSDAGDSTLSIIVYDATSGLLQKTSLGADFSVSASGVPALWEIELTYDVNPITVSYKVTRKTNTNEYVATGVTVPINTPLVAARPYVWRNNGAVASAVKLNINSCSLKLI